MELISTPLLFLGSLLLLIIISLAIVGINDFITAATKDKNGSRY